MTGLSRDFEKNFSLWLGADRAFSFWKGRVALYAILKALGVGVDDEVISPGYTCVMDVNPVKYLGAVPVYIDIDPITFNMAVDSLEEKITPRTRVIIAQHTYGYPCQMDAIMDIAHAHGVPVIEDCCLALGSKYKGRMVGTFGKASYFSFQWNKPFTTGLGGMAAIYDKELTQKVDDLCRESLRTPSRRMSFMLTVQRIIYWMFIYPRTTALATNLFRWMTKKRLVIGSSCNDEFIPEMPDDFFMAMGPSQKGAGARQLKKVDANMAHRRKMSKLYDELLTEAGFNIPAIPGYMDPVLVRYPLRVSDKQKVLSEAPSQQVEIGSWFECPLHPINTPMHLYDYQQGMCPEAEKASREVINLPLHRRVNENTVRKTVKFIAKYKQQVRK